MVSESPGDHALGPLGILPNVRVIDQPEVVDNGRRVLLVPFRPGDARGWLGAAVDEEVGGTGAGGRLLISHLGVVDDGTPPWLRDAKDAIPLDALRRICLFNDVECALLGNWHDHRLWPGGQDKAIVAQVGTLCPTGFDNPGAEGYGSLLIYETKPGVRRGALRRIEIPGPRFLTVRSRAEFDALPRDGGLPGCTRFLRWKVDPAIESLADARALVDERVLVGEFAGGEVVSDGGDPLAVSRGAATAAARASQGADGAEVLAAYVASMDVPEGVDRQAVIADAQRLLAKAG
jgi:hypothetical protein